MAVSLVLLPLSVIVPIVASLVYIAYLALNHTETSTGPAQSTKDYIPIAYVTAASMCLYYIFLFLQSYTTFVELELAQTAHREKKMDVKPDIKKIKYGIDNLNILAANRTALNYLEQLIPFLAAVYLYSTFVSVSGAVKFGWAWLFFRSYYGWAFKMPFPGLFLSTMPAYGCVWGMIGMTVYTVSK